MLADAQHCFARLFEGGPEKVDPALFTGRADRIALGLAVHANTVATARLAALRDTYPTLLGQLGEDRFAALSIEWLRRGPPLRGVACATGFAAWLEYEGAPLDAVSLALTDEAWLGAYHAGDEPALTLKDLAGLDVMIMALRPHKAARLVRAGALLMVRPAAQVRTLTLDDFELALFEAASPRAACGDMIETALARTERAPDAALAACLRLIGAGAFALADGASS